MIDNRSTHLNLPLPDAENQLNEDVPRIVSSLQAIDSEFQAVDTLLQAVNSALALKSTAADISAAVAALVGAAPSTLNTLAELAAALGDDANFSASVAAHLGAGGTVHSAVTQSVAGFMSASDKTKLDGVSGSNTGDQSLASLGAQAALVSGTSIKTINNQSILGAGNMDAPIPEPYLLMNQGVI